MTPRPRRPDGAVRRSALSGSPLGLLALLAQDSAQRGLEGLATARHVLAQRLVHERLIARAAENVRLAPEPLQDVVVDADRDPGLPLADRRHGAATSTAEVGLVPHGVLSYRRLSAGVALLAEMSRIRSSRHAQATTRTGGESAQGIHPHRDEALLANGRIVPCQCELVVQHGRRVGEVDAVLADVRGSLPLVPLELHDSEYMHARADTQALVSRTARRSHAPWSTQDGLTLRIPESGMWNMNGLDVVVALLLDAETHWTYQSLAERALVSTSQAHRSIERLRKARLVATTGWEPRRSQLIDFIVHGVPHVFPAELGPVALGVPTAWGSAELARELGLSPDDAPVWPSAAGSVRGPSVVPLHRSVPMIALREPRLHGRLALVDCLRLGRARERRLAAGALHGRLREHSGA